MPKLDSLPDSLSLEIQSSFSKKEDRAYAFANKATYINGIKKLFHIIHTGNLPLATEAQKNAATRAWVVLYRRLISQLSFAVTAQLNGKTKPNFLLYLLERETYSDIRGLLASLKMMDKQLASPDIVVRIQALQIGISIVLKQSATYQELEFLNFLANIPTYRAEALLGLMPWLSREQVSELANKYMEDPHNLSNVERRLLLPLLASRWTVPDTMLHLEAETAIAKIDRNLEIIKIYPNLGQDFIQKIPQMLMQTTEVKNFAEGLQAFFSKRPDLLTTTVVQSIINKYQSLAPINSEERAVLINTQVIFSELRLDLLRDNPELRLQIKRFLFSVLDEAESIVYTDEHLFAAEQAVIKLWPLLETGGSLTNSGSLYNGLLIDLSTRSRKNWRFLRILTAFLENHPLLIGDIDYKDPLEVIVLLLRDHNKKVRLEALKTLAPLQKLHPNLLDDSRIRSALCLNEIWQDYDFLHTLIPVLIKLIAIDKGQKIDLGHLRAQALWALSGSDIMVPLALDILLCVFEQEPALLDNVSLEHIFQQYLRCSHLGTTWAAKNASLILEALMVLYGKREEPLPAQMLHRHFLGETALSYTRTLSSLSIFFEIHPNLLDAEALQIILLSFDRELFLSREPIYSATLNLLLIINTVRPDLFSAPLSNILLEKLNKLDPKSINYRNLLDCLRVLFFEKQPHLWVGEVAQKGLQTHLLRQIEIDTSFVIPIPCFEREAPQFQPYFKKKHETLVAFDQLVEQLETFTKPLIDKGTPTHKEYDPEYENIGKAIVQLSTAIKDARKDFFIHDCFVNTSREALSKFQQVLVDAFKPAEQAFIQHHSIWAEIHPILKAILGVLALIPLGIPALLVEKYSTHGYVGTFYKKPPPGPYEELPAFKVYKENLLRGF